MKGRAGPGAALKALRQRHNWTLAQVSQRHLGGQAELSQRAKMAESGRRALEYIAANDFSTTLDISVFHAEGKPLAQHAEAWIAAYRMTAEGRRFPGVERQLRWALGVGDRQQRQRLTA